MRTAVTIGKQCDGCGCSVLLVSGVFPLCLVFFHHPERHFVRDGKLVITHIVTRSCCYSVIGAFWISGADLCSSYCSACFLLPW